MMYIVGLKQGSVSKNGTPRRSCWESNMRPLNPEGLGVAFFATGPDLGPLMYIFTTLEFPKHYFEFHLLTTSVNAKYYYQYELI